MEVIKIGRVKYVCKNHNARAIVDDVINDLEDRITADKVDVMVQDNLPTVFCDENRLNDVFNNLVVNAIKFIGDNGKKKITIGCHENGSYYKFFVEDTGIGIRSEYQEMIFKVFRRLNDVDVEGTGVGLAIVKKIIDLHNGKIWVESPLDNGKGSRFMFTIPIVKEKDK
jgi:signal transduction histidine kinase